MTSRVRCIVLISRQQSEYLRRAAAEHGHTMSEILRRVLDLHMAQNPLPKEQVNHGPRSLQQTT